MTESDVGTLRFAHPTVVSDVDAWRPLMSHAEAVHPLQPAAGATAALVAFIDGLRYGALDAEVRHYARRHLLDTVGVMICGAAGDIANRAERALAAVRGAGHIPVP